MWLNKKARDLCTIILPWGKYSYNSLPMGFVGSSDIFQNVLGTMFADLEYVLVHIDDIIIIGTEDFDSHLEQIEEVLARLKDKGFQVNPLKSFWGKKEVEYLGFVLTRDGIKPQRKNRK